MGWNLGSKPDEKGQQEVVVGLDHDDTTGAIEGVLVFRGDKFHVTGNWAASGSVPGRKFSAFALMGDDGQPAPQYVAAAGSIDGPGAAPTAIDLVLLRSSTITGREFAWSGVLHPS